jgi:hypothetical protein
MRPTKQRFRAKLARFTLTALGRDTFGFDPTADAIHNTDE